MWNWKDTLRKADSFNSIEEIDAHFKKGAEFWDNVIKRTYNEDKKARYIQAKDDTIAIGNYVKMDFLRLQNKSIPCDDIVTTTGKERKEERCKIIVMYPHI